MKTIKVNLALQELEVLQQTLPKWEVGSVDDSKLNVIKDQTTRDVLHEDLQDSQNEALSTTKEILKKIDLEHPYIEIPKEQMELFVQGLTHFRFTIYETDLKHLPDDMIAQITPIDPTLFSKKQDMLSYLTYIVLGTVIESTIQSFLD